jgi:hypothetical protein
MISGSEKEDFEDILLSPVSIGVGIRHGLDKQWCGL